MRKTHRHAGGYRSLDCLILTILVGPSLGAKSQNLSAQRGNLFVWAVFDRASLCLFGFRPLGAVRKISNQPPAGPPATIQTRVQSAPPARLSEALRRWSTNHRGSSDKSTPTQHTHAGDICHTLKQYTLTTHGDRVERRRRRQWHARADGLGRGGAATAWAAAALSARARRLPAQLERGQVHREAWRRGDARRRWRAGERPARGEADR